MTPAEHRTLLRNLKHVCGVFHNDVAPLGWVEIQRFDSRDTGPEDLPALDCDLAAAMLVCEKAKMPGLAYAMLLPLEVLAPLVWTPDGDVELDVTNAVAEALEKLGWTPEDGEGRWRAIVPAVAAHAAGLLSKRDARAAHRQAVYT